MPFFRVPFALGIALLMAALGCGGSSSSSDSPPKTAAVGTGRFDGQAPSATLRAPPPKPRISPPTRPAESPPAAIETPPKRTQAELIPSFTPAADSAPPIVPLPRIDDAAVQSLGIRKLTGTHLILYTDLPSQPAIDELPHVFALAVPQWCDYFGVPKEHVADWKIAGYLIQDKDRFRKAGLLPHQLPPFLNGYHRGAEIWAYEQPSPYYRRHLLLHEGTHAFMSWSLEGTGPPWYMEGTAELFGTHRWQNDQLTLRYFPHNKKEVPEWGRIKIVKDDVRAGRGKTLMDVLHYDSQSHLRVEAYGWSWAVAAFFDNHPSYQQRFRELKKYVRDRGDSFSERFIGWFHEDSQPLWREWQWYIANIEYGYDVAREAFQRKEVMPLPATGSKVEIATDRGWQSTGLRLEPGEWYAVRASGRYSLAQTPRPWWSEPNGVTIRYHRGQPLGLLLGAIVDESDPAATDNGFLTPLAIGVKSEIQPPGGGTLYLRVNDAPSELADNRGTVTVTIERQ